MPTFPAADEAARYFFTYIDCVPRDAEVMGVLHAQLDETEALLRGVSDARSLHRYAPGKWSIREVLGHLSDCERMFAHRALWFARGLEPALPSFDQDVAVAGAGSDAQSWRALVDEFRAVRQATIALFDLLPPEAWTRRGTAGENPFSVNALAYICAGHVAHHLRILRERYL